MGLWMGYVLVYVSAVEAIFCLGFCICICIIGSICISPHTRTYQFNIHGASVWKLLARSFTPPSPFLSLALSLPQTRSLLCIAASPSIAIAAKRNTKFAQIFIALFLQRLLGSLSVGVRQCVCVCAGICVRQCVCNLGEFICHIPTI